MSLYNEAVKKYAVQIDLVAYMYDLTAPHTLDDLFEIDARAALAPRKVLIVNKRDLAEELSISIEGEETAKAIGASTTHRR